MRCCRRCGTPFDYCASCQPGRRYCCATCSEAAREEIERAARAKYNARDSPEGLAWHALEEQDRRVRQAKARVGDRRCSEATGELQVQASAAKQAAEEACDEPTKPAARASIVEWILVVSADLLPEASRRVGTEAICPFCGRQGRIVRAVSVEQWRRECRGLG